MILSKGLRILLAFLVIVLLLFEPFRTYANEEINKQKTPNNIWVQVGSSGGELFDSKVNGVAALKLSQGTELYGQQTSDGWLSINFNGQTYYMNLKSTTLLPDKVTVPEVINTFVDVTDNTILKAIGNEARTITVLHKMSLPTKMDETGQQIIVIGETSYTVQNKVEENSDPSPTTTKPTNGNLDEAKEFNSYFKTSKRTAVYETTSAQSKIVGYLQEGETFKRTKGSTLEWHEILFGGKSRYVLADDTVPVDTYDVTNQIDHPKTIGTLTVTDEAPVYDNTRKGQGLVQFASIAGGETYPIVKKYGDDWWEVVVDERLGYIYKSIVGNVSMSFRSTDHFFKVTKDDVTVYDNSTGKLVPMGKLIKGQVYPRISDYGDWHQIKFGNGYGYVWEAATEPANESTAKNLNTSYQNSNIKIKISADRVVYAAGLIPIATLKSGISYPIVADSGDWWQVLAAGRAGYVYKSHYATREFTSSDHFFKIIQDKVSVYDNSTGKLVPVGTLVNGQIYQRVSDYGDWQQIKFGNGYGYVWKDATIPDSGTTAKGVNTSAKNNGDYINIRENSVVYAAGKIPFATLLKGLKYPIISDSGDWWQISVSGRIGYVYKSIYATRNFKSRDHYFQVLQDNVTVYDNSTGKLVPIGKLDKSRIYPRTGDYGDWHQIKYAGHYGYVWKDATMPVDVTHSPFVTILAYHNLTDKVTDGANISPARFREHMEYFKNKGYNTITLTQLLDFLNGEGSLPDKPLMITFDDSYLSQYTDAYPILKSLGMKATYFAIAGWLGQSLGSLKEFTWDQAREMEASGIIDIESHTYASHDKVNGKPLLTYPLAGETQEQYKARITDDLTKAKSVLEEELGKKVKALAYPFGSWNETVKNVAKDAGYEALFLYNTGPGIVYAGEDPLIINRYGVNGNMSAYDVWSRFLQH